MNLNIGKLDKNKPGQIFNLKIMFLFGADQEDVTGLIEDFIIVNNVQSITLLYKNQLVMVMPMREMWPNNFFKFRYDQRLKLFIALHRTNLPDYIGILLKR